ncbi:cell envelope integrity protein CreD [Porifericola rhodea]|uniref:cell envelope integrity protein CreD n=1 Tax=Porifericola rhodea TaxID=930972 RepID=UPI002665FE54|nr:cell envelope integrity protein CreD [Porifericola rhodea]WKN33015.1 cell envelope integrity protein CreD [Porifericola rhodea]
MPGKTKTFYERFSSWTRNSITLRIVSIGILVLLLLIPSSMIESLIRERQNYRQQAIQDVSASWADAQIIGGPILTLPYRTTYVNSEQQLTETVAYAHFLPDDLNIRGEVSPESRKRGIYEAVVYRSSLSFDGSFSQPMLEVVGLSEKDVIWHEAFISLGIPDMRGIEEKIELNWNGASYPFSPGTGPSQILASGVRVSIPLDSALHNFNFKFELKLNGSSSLSFLPLGKNTNVSIQSDWGNPSFVGAFLPDSHQVNAEGFKANWEVLHLNRNFPQVWKGEQYSFSLQGLAYEKASPDYYVEPNLANSKSYSFGVNLLMPVDEYQKSMRSAKYAIMFIALTFLTFFFVEILNRKRIHPIQYLLVGLALCLFFTLLLAISEHSSFNIAYIISCIAVSALIAVYVQAVFKDKRLSSLLILLLLLMYGFIFTLLQLQDYALLIGSIALFIILAVVMYISRKIDWYALSEQEDD